MKRLFTIILLVVAIACDNEKDPSYADITGDWKFANSISSGSFKITKTSDGKYNVQSYKINGKSYTASEVRLVTVNGTSLGNIGLYTADGFITFSGNAYSSDFLKITANTYTYANDCIGAPCPHTLVDDEVTVITR
jgi:hypothetical protein